MQASKVVPMINGVEVKVGQIWRDGAGLIEEISSVTRPSIYPIMTTAGNYYTIDGKHFCNDPDFHLAKLVKDVNNLEDQQVFTRSELSALIEVNACEIAFLSRTVALKKSHEQFYYAHSDKNVPETAPYFVKLNSMRNEIKKYKAKLKKLVALQCKLKEMYNSSK